MITKQQRTALRSLAQGLPDLVYIGKGDITDNVVKQVNDNLYAHEIIKIKVQDNTSMSTEEICNELEKKVQKPVYYLLCNPIGGWFEFEKNNKELQVCPKCGGEFKVLKDSYVEKICDKCRLAFITYEK